MPWYRKLHWQIIIGLVAGVAYGILAAGAGWGRFTADWIAPFGKIFINLLKLIAVPLILASLITGVASLSDLKKLSRIGGKTIFIYIATTVVSVSIGLLLVNVFRPGESVPPDLRDRLQASYQADAAARTAAARQAQERGPLQPLVDIIPDNLIGAASSNRNMLQIVFAAILVGIGLIKVSGDKARPLIVFFESLNEVIVKLVEMIMLMAPLGVFALMAGTITAVSKDDPRQVMDLISALGYYCLVVVAGLALHTYLTYPLLIKLATPLPITRFWSGIAPAQLVAFSTSSSGATLPVTMERCEEHLGVSEEVSSFVLPLGATINMDGTALYQAVAAVFIARVAPLLLVTRR
ncbi:MAG: dicarboxylate/amino acid:cation symporter, partial [Acidobacteriota bacterium]